MRNYADSKCSYGYMTVCDLCKRLAPPSVDLSIIVEGFPVKQCELCKGTLTRHEELLIKALDAYPGTPEELGSLLYDATAIIPEWYAGERRWRAIELKYSCRRTIRNLPGGEELLKFEEKQNRAYS